MPATRTTRSSPTGLPRWLNWPEKMLSASPTEIVTAGSTAASSTKPDSRTATSGEREIPVGGAGPLVDRVADRERHGGGAQDPGERSRAGERHRRLQVGMRRRRGRRRPNIAATAEPDHEACDRPDRHELLPHRVAVTGGAGRRREHLDACGARVGRHLLARTATAGSACGARRSADPSARGSASRATRRRRRLRCGCSPRAALISRSSDAETRDWVRYWLMSDAEGLSLVSVSVTNVRICRVAAFARPTALCPSAPVAEMVKIGAPGIGLAPSRDRTSCSRQIQALRHGAHDLVTRHDPAVGRGERLCALDVARERLHAHVRPADVDRRGRLVRQGCASSRRSSRPRRRSSTKSTTIGHRIADGRSGPSGCGAARPLHRRADASRDERPGPLRLVRGGESWHRAHVSIRSIGGGRP